MILYGFIVALFTFLTPIIFPFIFILGIGFQKLSKNNKDYWTYSILLIISISTMFYCYVVYFDNIVSSLSIVYSLIYFSFLYIIILMFLSLYLIGFFNLPRKIVSLLGVLVTFVLSIQFSMLFLQSSLPITGSLMANDNKFDYLNFYSGVVLAICLTLSLILFVSRKLHQKYKGKSWSQNVSKLLGIYILITQIISILDIFNVKF